MPFTFAILNGLTDRLLEAHHFNRGLIQQNGT
jgi:hypothetical protein